MIFGSSHFLHLKPRYLKQVWLKIPVWDYSCDFNQKDWGAINDVILRTIDQKDQDATNKVILGVFGQKDQHATNES